MKYRSEIDGLRSIAVLPVLFFHAGLFGMSGGYVGVDVFFVISGFLITSIIVSEVEEGRFSVVNFYERRARRILPALSAVLVATCVAAFTFMPANLLKSYAQSLVSITTFSSNIFFYLTNDYFSTASDQKPLLHTWSLAVEEQYYIIFPLFILYLWFLGKKKLTAVMGILALLSLAFSQYLAMKQSTDFNFYLIFSRAWELLVGSIVAIVGVNKLSASNPKVREVLAWFGLALIGYSIFAFDKNTPFPSLYALIPVGGAALVIIYANNQTLAGRLLSSKVLVYIGLISYSLYLWHQPIFAFLRMKIIGEPTALAFAIAIGATFLLAQLTYLYIETPFRKKDIFTRSLIFKYSSISLAFFFVIGLSGHLFGGFEGRFPAQPYAGTAEFSPYRVDCHTRGADYLKPIDACVYGGENISWASFGDSHTVEPAFALSEALEKNNEGLLHLSFSGCPAALNFSTVEPGCSMWINEALVMLENRPDIKNVLLGFRHSAYLFGDQLHDYPEVPTETPRFVLSEAIKHMDPREAYWMSLNEIVQRLIASGKVVYLMYPIPELPTHIEKAMTPFSVFGDKTVLDLTYTTTTEYYYERNQFILSKLDSLAYGSKLKAIKPFEAFCYNGFCPAIADDVALYFDDDHLSVGGSRLLISKSGLFP